MGSKALIGPPCLFILAAKSQLQDVFVLKTVGGAINHCGWQSQEPWILPEALPLNPRGRAPLRPLSRPASFCICELRRWHYWYISLLLVPSLLIQQWLKFIFHLSSEKDWLFLTRSLIFTIRWTDHTWWRCLHLNETRQKHLSKAV